jgi:hypothetical protein
MNAEKLKVVGILTIQTWKNGKLIDTWVDKNLTVNVGLDTICKCISGTNGPTEIITKVGFGTTGTAAALTDTALTAPFYKTIAATTFPLTGKVKYDWALETYENNGVTIKEFGLMLGTNDLFARRVHPGISKDNTVKLTGSWTLQF